MIAVNADSALVVDCPRGGVKQATALLNKLSLAQFDVVVTHQDMDHCEGVQDLLRLFGKRSTTLYMNPVGRPRPQDRSHVKTVLQGILSAVEEIGASTADAVVETVGNTGSIGWSVLAPRHVHILGAALLGDVANRLSAVVLVRIRSFTFLIPGDIDDVATRELLTSGTDLSADVFLLPHHGAKLPTINQLLAAVDPRYVVVSAGRRASHPALETLRAAAAFDCRIMCTEVAAHCHQGAIDPQHCAGSIVFKLRGDSLEAVPSEAEHMVRIRQLDTPVCLGSRNAENQRPKSRRP